MKNLYKLDRVTLVAVFLVYAFSEITAMFLSNKNLSSAPSVGKWMELGIYTVALIISFVIYYGVMYFILKNNESDFQTTIFVNIAIGLTVIAILAIIAGLVTDKSLNIWTKGIFGLLGNGLTAALNWKYLNVSQASKIKVSVLTVIYFVISLI